MPPRKILISSESNERFKEFMGLWAAKGIKRAQQCLVCGAKLVEELWASMPDRCVSVILSERHEGWMGPEQLPQWVLSESLFRKIDQLGTDSPMLVVSLPEFLPLAAGDFPGPAIVLPLQGPENVGASLRSAAAFGVRNIVMTDETAHPFLPRSIRASAGTVFTCSYWQYKGPLSTLPLPIERAVALDGAGVKLDHVAWPQSPVFLVGVEGQGLANVDTGMCRVRVPMESGVESLNATVALSITLYHWYSTGRPTSDK